MSPYALGGRAATGAEGGTAMHGSRPRSPMERVDRAELLFESRQYHQALQQASTAISEAAALGLPVSTSWCVCELPKACLRGPR